MMKVAMKAQRRGMLWVAWVSACLALPAPAQARRDSEFIVDHVHSSLPLYTFEWDHLWPRGFTNGLEFGCRSRIEFGDWRFTPAASNESEEESWYRFGNYGAFHCAAIVRHANEQTELEAARFDYGFFVQLGNVRHQSTEWELWALQVGMRPGSEYILLAREAHKSGLVVDFQVLQQRCPRGLIREARGLDVWSTRYCAIDSRAELLSLARSMLKLPAVGTIVRASKPE
jgi:hypothetical protein